MDLELEMVLAHARRLQRADHTYSNITVPVTVTPSSRRSAAGCPKLFQLSKSGNSRPSSDRAVHSSQRLCWDEPGTARIPVLHRNLCSLSAPIGSKSTSGL